MQCCHIEHRRIHEFMMIVFIVRVYQLHVKVSLARLCSKALNRSASNEICQDACDENGKSCSGLVDVKFHGLTSYLNMSRTWNVRGHHTCPGSHGGNCRIGTVKPSQLRDIMILCKDSYACRLKGYD